MKNKTFFDGMFNRADIILALVLVLCGACSLLVLRMNKGQTDILSAVVTVSGEPFGTYPLAENRVIEIHSEYGDNILTIEDGAIYMSESGCPNHDCEKFGKIRSQGQMIICIPNRVVVTIEGFSAPEVDAVLY